MFVDVCFDRRRVRSASECGEVAWMTRQQNIGLSMCSQRVFVEPAVEDFARHKLSRPESYIEEDYVERLAEYL